MTNYDYGYNVESTINTTMSNPGLSALFIGIIIFSLLLGLIKLISYWKIFTKKGKPGWAILIPIYNVIVQIQVANLSMIYFLLLLIPIVNIYAIFKINISMAHNFGKTTGFGIGLVLLPIIFIPLLAFSDIPEEKNNNDEKDFNAINVINNNDNNNNVTDNAIPTIENLEVTPINIENNEQENISNTKSQNEIKQKNNITETNNVNNEENNNVIAENINTESSINNAPTETIDIENNVNNNTPIETINTENNTETNNIEIPSSNESMNAFNVKPVETNNNLDTEVLDIPQVENKQDNIIENQTTETITSDNKKYCKNCGKEMPSIVSICPNCGTDNE